MPKRKYSPAYQTALCRASARAILEQLGVTRFPKLNDDEPFAPREPEVVIGPPKRFRRTKLEMQELKSFTDWQLARRLLRTSQPLSVSDLEAFAVDA